MEEKDMRKYVEDNLWKVRDCKDYELEHDECKSISARFYQYFVDGDFSDCSKWKQDYNNCRKCEEKEDLQALYSIILHENERIEKRLKGHLANNVWERRKTPNPNWDRELPDWRNERQKNSFPNDDTEDDEKKCIIF